MSCIAGLSVLIEKQGYTFTAVYTYGNALLRRNSEYPLYDGHGSERTVTASNQSVTGTITFEAFGQTVGTSGSSDSPYVFAGAWGYRTDGDAGLMHVGARYYDAQVGRFITRDTVLSEHPYLHCEHDPVNAVDPSGRWGLSIGSGGAIVAPGFGGFAEARPVIADDGCHIAWHWGAAGNGHGVGASVGPSLAWTPGRVVAGPDHGYWLGGLAGWGSGAGLQLSFGPTGGFGAISLSPPTPLPTFGVGAASGTFDGFVSVANPDVYQSEFMF